MCIRDSRRGVLLRFPHPSDPNVIPEYEDEKKMYQAFGEQTKWDKLLDVNYVADLNDKIENGQYKELIQLSEACLLYTSVDTGRSYLKRAGSWAVI